MNNTQIFTATTQLNAEQAKNELKSLTKTYADLEAKKNKMIATGGREAAGLKEVAKAMRETKTHISALQTRLQEIDHVMNNLSTAGIKDIQAAMRKINAELRSGSVERGSAEWRKLQNQLKACKSEIKAINDESKESESLFSRMGDGFNKYSAMIATGAASMAGITLTIRSAVEAYAKMDDVLTNVTKYTGQTKAEVEEMNEDFKKMDTRTSREALNDLAGAAGRLGITGKENIEEFVDGADKIGVALGDDLGDGAVEKIGKLAQAFGEDKTKGLRGAMLATGSAVNDLAQNSSANAGYIVDFTADLSGVGMQAKMTQAQIMGLASGLDQNMQEEKTSATVFSQLITKMYQDPARFAKIAGLSVKEFSRMMKEDANGALIKFLESMKARGGFSAMAPLFTEMKLDGTRAIGVLSSVATHIDQVKTAQNLATKSYAQGTSVVQEFNTQNSSVQARLDKAKKEFGDLTIELGRKLMPVAKVAISTTSIGIRALSTLVTFTLNHYRAIIVLSTAIGVITAIYKANTIAVKADAAATAIHSAVMKAHAIVSNILRGSMLALQGTYILCTRGVQGLVAWMRLMKLESMANPYAALATVLLTVGVALYALISKVKTLSKENNKSLLEARKHAAAMKDMDDVNKQVGQSTQEEIKRIKHLSEIIHSNSSSIDERRQAIAALHKLVPKYHASLTNEGTLHENNTKAIKDHISEIEDLAMAEALYDKIMKIQGDKYAAYIKLRKKQFNVDSVNYELRKHPKKYNETVTTTTGNPYSGFVTTTIPTEANRKKHLELDIQKKLRQEAQDEYKIQVSRENDIETFLNTHKKVKKQYDKIYIKKTIGNGVVDNSNYESIIDTSPGTGGGHNGHNDNKDDKYNKEIASAEEFYKKEKLQLSESIRLKQITEDEYNESSYKKNIAYLSKKIIIEKKYKKSTTDTEQELSDAMASEVDRRVKLQQDKMQEELRQRDLSNNAAQMSAKRNLIDGQLTQEQYDAKLLDIERKYHQDRLDIIKKYDGDESDEQKKLLDMDLEKFKENREAMRDELQKKYDSSTNTKDKISINDTMYQNDLISFKDYEQRKVDIAKEKADQRKKIEEMLYNGINELINSYSNYVNAASEAEKNAVSAKYDKEIEAAGNNSTLSKKLEAKKQKEINRIKNDANKKAMAIELAQAVASTAVAAINAYKTAPPPTMIFGPIAAGMATAAGMLQIATIKKQHEAQSSGYYHGGYTDGGDYHKEVGVVHAGEFVLNHEAVNNPALRPTINLLDYAQRNNTVGALRPADVNPTVPTTKTIVIVQQNAETSKALAVVAQSTDKSAAVIDKLNKKIDDGIKTYVLIDGPDGVYNQLKYYNKLLNNK